MTRLAATVAVTSLTALLAAAGTAPAASARPAAAAAGPQATAAPAETVLRRVGFDRGLAGWGAEGARLSLVDSPHGGDAVHAAARTGAVRSFRIYAAPRPVRWAARGRSFGVQAWLRGSRAAGRVCVALREVAGGRVLGTRTACAAADGRWRKVAVTLRTSRAGAQVGVAIHSRRAGWLEADEVAVTRVLSGSRCRSKKKCDPPAPAAPPPATEPAPTTPPPTTTEPPPTTTEPPPTTTEPPPTTTEPAP
jgi:hypothetical protein